MFCQIKSCDVQCSYNNSDFSYKNLRWGLLVLCSHVSLHVQFAHAKTLRHMAITVQSSFILCINMHHYALTCIIIHFCIFIIKVKDSKGRVE